jgi:high affinity Mn2+ porin
MNFEQQLANDFGVVLRAGLSQGTVEEVDFTDINKSLSGGSSLAGTRWGRRDDTAGLAGAINRISHRGKLYLAAGGLGGIIGDGRAGSRPACRYKLVVEDAGAALAVARPPRPP